MTKQRTDHRLHDAIRRAVRGKGSPWRTHDKYPGGSNFRRMFNAGDDQALLWEICLTPKNKPIAQWAAQALRSRVLRAAKGEFASWDEVFGKIFADKRERKGIKTKARMYEVFDEMNKWLDDGYKIDNDLFERVGEKLGMKRENVKTLWTFSYADQINRGRYVSKPHRERVAASAKAKLRGQTLA